MIFVYTNLLYFVISFLFSPMFFFPPSSMEAHNLKLLFNPFAVSGEGDFKMLLLNRNKAYQEAQYLSSIGHAG